MGKQITFLLEVVAERGQAIFPIGEKLPTSRNRRFDEGVAAIDKIIYRLINERRQSSDFGSDLLGMLLEARDEDSGEGMDDVQLRDELFTIFLAGHETTAIALTWSMALLSLNPSVRRRLQTELDQVLEGRIPDASEEFSRKYGLSRYSHLPDERNPWKDPYWFRTEFTVPEERREQRVWLNLAGIHYRAELWLNGRMLAGPEQVAGMFGDWSFDITSFVSRDSPNALAIKIFPLDTPGLPGAPQLEVLGSFGLNGGETGDIGKNVTMQSAVA